VRAADIDAKHRRSLKPTHVKDLGECRLEFSLCTWRLDWLKIAVSRWILTMNPLKWTA
jgi:hypothetical protein